jgi:glutamine synthetase
MLSAAMDGVDKKMTPSKPLNNVNVYALSSEERAAMGIRQLPGSLNEALNELEKNELIKKSLGSELYSAFMRAKRAEWDDYRIFVTDWEKQRYLETA